MLQTHKQIQTTHLQKQLTCDSEQQVQLIAKKEDSSKQKRCIFPCNWFRALCQSTFSTVMIKERENALGALSTSLSLRHQRCVPGDLEDIMEVKSAFHEIPTEPQQRRPLLWPHWQTAVLSRSETDKLQSFLPTAWRTRTLSLHSSFIQT